MTFRNGSPKTASSATSAHLYVLMPPSVRYAPERGRGKGSSRKHQSTPQRPSARTLQGLSSQWLSARLTVWAARLCVNVCPVTAKAKAAGTPEKAALVMKSSGDPARQQQAVFDYCVENVSEEAHLASRSVKGSQFEQPLLEFSGSCAGCAETSYARLITQLFGERMYISNATGCSSIWGGSRTRYSLYRQPCHKARSGMGQLPVRGQCRARSRYLSRTEDHQKPPHRLRQRACRHRQGPMLSSPLSTSISIPLTTEQRTTPLQRSSLPMLENCSCECCGELKAKILAEKDYLSKKSIWIFGGDGWAYDIGFGGLDHVIASGEDVNIMVFDTEVYSNTGGQASKASNIGQVAQFAAAGKAIGKKDLARDRHVLRLRLCCTDRHGRRHEPDPQGSYRG